MKKIKVTYQMSAYIQAEDLEECQNIWDNTDLTDDWKVGKDTYIKTEYDELLGVYDANTLEEIDHKDW